MSGSSPSPRSGLPPRRPQPGAPQPTASRTAATPAAPRRPPPRRPATPDSGRIGRRHAPEHGEHGRLRGRGRTASSTSRTRSSPSSRTALTVIVKRIASPVVAVRGVLLHRRRLRRQMAGRGAEPSARAPGRRRQQRAPHRGREPRPASEDRQQLQRLHHRRPHRLLRQHHHAAHGARRSTWSPAGCSAAKITRAGVPPRVPGRAARAGDGARASRTGFCYLSLSNRYHVSPARVPVIGYQEVIQGLRATTCTAITRWPTSRTTWSSRWPATSTRRRCWRRCRRTSRTRSRAGSSRTTSPPSRPWSPRGRVVATFPKLGQARLRPGVPVGEARQPRPVRAGPAGRRPGRRRKLDRSSRSSATSSSWSAASPCSD